MLSLQNSIDLPLSHEQDESCLAQTPELEWLVTTQAEKSSLLVPDGGLPLAVPAEKANEQTPAPTLKGIYPNVRTWADMAKVMPKVSWAWKGWLPNALVTILASSPGEGKSALALRIAGCFTSGWPWPDGQKFDGEAGRVVWAEAEAGQAMNLDRAQAWGLPMDKILVASAEGFDDIQLDSSSDKKYIEYLMHLPDVRLLVLDSLRGAYPGDENASDIITITKWLAKLSRDTGKPILILHHFRKPINTDPYESVPLDRLRGSTAIAQLGRSVWFIQTPNPSQPDVRQFFVKKANLCKRPDAIGFEIGDSGVAFFPAPPPRQQPRPMVDELRDLMPTLLAKGPVRSTELRKEIEGRGLSWHAFRKLAPKIGVGCEKRGDGWYRLPPEEATPSS